MQEIVDDFMFYRLTIFEMVATLFCLIVVKNPHENKEERETFHWAVPKILPAERYFLSQLISSPTKEVTHCN